MGSRSCSTLLTLALLVGALPACGGNTASTSASGGGGGASGNSGGGGAAEPAATGGAASACTVGADHTCNDDPLISSLRGHCEAGVCQCGAGTERSPTSGKCRSTACYSPTQNVDSAYAPGAVGCSCDPTVDYGTCRADGSGRLVAFSCFGGNWQAAQDGACAIEAATITLQRSPCFGSCPAYSVTLTSDGLVTYEGASYVLVHGMASHSVAPSAVRALADELENARYFELSVPENCTQYRTDHPIVTTSLARYRLKHEIVHDLGNGCAPPVLAMLEQRIDEVAGTSEWVTCPPADYCREP